MTVVHMVKSSSGNVDRRNTIRETWGGTHEVRLNKSGSRHFPVFVVGLNDNYEALRKEGEEHGDVLIVDISDTAKLAFILFCFSWFYHASSSNWKS